MKTALLSLLIFSTMVSAAAQEAVLRVTNPAPFDRPRETIEVQWAELQGNVRGADPGSLAVFDGNNQLVSQWVDTDGNGTPDVLLFQSAFGRGEEKRFTLKRAISKKEMPIIADAKFVLPRADVAWENDRIAYRIYGSPLAGDVRNGLDVWVKRVRSLIIDTWYGGDSLKGNKRISYHVDHGQGADLFNVGKSLGAGACALFSQGVLHQPGLFKAHRIIASGPIRAMFSVSYAGDSLEGHPFTEEKTYILDAGENLNRIEVRYDGIRQEGAVAVAAGLVKRKNTYPRVNEQEGWLSLWGLTDEDSANGYLGTGVVMPGGSFREMRETEDHYLVIGSVSPGNRLTYYAGAGWTRSGDFPTREAWNSYLSGWARSLDYPLQVKVSSGNE
jgi:hypothetical protein